MIAHAVHRPSARIRSFQIWSIVLLIAGGALNYVDRATLSVANTRIQHDLGIPVGRMGLLLSAFLWAYAIAQLPVGGLIDRYGPRKMLGLGLFSWSLAQAAGGLVNGFGVFIAARFALGAGEAPLFPGGARVVRDWFGIRERGFATGLCQSAGSLGNFIALPLLTFLMLRLNWRWMFVIVGALGVVLALVWWSVHRDPAEVSLNADETLYLTEGDENSTTRTPSFAEWGALFAHRTTWGMIAGFFGTVYTLWLYTSWMPYYLERERHMSIEDVGRFGGIPFLFGCVGAIVGGGLCDFLTRRGWAPIAGRKMLISSSLVGLALCTVGTVYATANWAALAFISMSLFLVYIASSAAWATVPIAAPSQYTASLGSIQNFGGYIGGALAPMVTGFIVEATGSFSGALLLAAALSVVSAGAYLALVRGPIPAPSEEAGLSGIQGWLTFVAIGLAISPLLNAAALALTTAPSLYGGDGPSFTNYYYYSLLLGTAAIAVTIYLNVLFYQRKKEFPRYMIAYLVATFILILTGDVFFERSGYAGLLQSFLALVIWTPYFLRSRRVKATFIR